MNRLDVSLVRDRVDGLRRLLEADGVGLTRLLGDTLELDTDTLLTSLDLLGGGLLNTVDEVETALGVTDVLDTASDTLLDVAVANGLLDDHTDRALGNVENDTGLTVEPLVGQRLSGSVADNVDNVANLVCLEVNRHGDNTMSLEVARERVTSSTAKSTTLTHCSIYRWFVNLFGIVTTVIIGTTRRVRWSRVEKSQLKKFRVESPLSPRLGNDHNNLKAGSE